MSRVTPNEKEKGMKRGTEDYYDMLKEKLEENEEAIKEMTGDL